jgi:hypothetical protein
MTVLLGPADPLPPTTRRILVTGSSGAGKSTLRQTISTRPAAAHRRDRLASPRTELDAPTHLRLRRRSLHLGGRLGRRMAVRTSAGSAARPRRHPHLAGPQPVDCRPPGGASHVATAHSPRRLWNGNVEPPLRTIFTDRDHIIRWSWRTHRKRQREAREVAHRTVGPLVVRLTGQHQVDNWVRGRYGSWSIPARMQADSLATCRSVCRAKGAGGFPG